MKIVVHAGMQKTGSSAIQDYLHGQREALAADRINYPDFGHREHWLVSAAFVRVPANYHHVVRRYKGADPTAAVTSVRDELRDFVRASHDHEDVLLLSHEDLSVGHTATRLSTFLQEAAGKPVDLTFVAYVRHPASMYASAIQQALKSDRDRTFLPSDWLNPHLKRAFQLADFGGAKVILRPFAPPTVKDWDVVEDFRALCGKLIDRPLPAYVPGRGVNTSMSAEACAILEMGRWLPNTEKECKHLSRVVRRFDEQRGGSRLKAPKAWLDDVSAVNALPWAQVVEMLDCSKETRAALLTAPGKPSKRYTDDDLHRWLVSHLDQEWCQGLRDYCADPENVVARKSRVADWLDRNILGRIDAIKMAA